MASYSISRIVILFSQKANEVDVSRGTWIGSQGWGRLLPSDFYYYALPGWILSFLLVRAVYFLLLPRDSLSTDETKDRMAPKMRNIVTEAARLAAIIRSGQKLFLLPCLETFLEAIEVSTRAHRPPGDFLFFFSFTTEGRPNSRDERLQSRDSSGLYLFSMTATVSVSSQADARNFRLFRFKVPIPR